MNQDEQQRRAALALAEKLNRFKCHKIVSAARIASIGITDRGTVLQLEPAPKVYIEHVVDGNWAASNAPQPGGYFVVYGDGYTSYSPAKQFMEGYSEMVFNQRQPEGAPLQDAVGGNAVLNPKAAWPFPTRGAEGT